MLWPELYFLDKINIHFTFTSTQQIEKQIKD